MSYEVYIRVAHHPRHNDDFEKTETDAVKFADDGKDPLEHVVNALRGMADRLDPTFTCGRCGKTRGEHHREGNLYRCFNRYGPIVQHLWWIAGAVEFACNRCGAGKGEHALGESCNQNCGGRVIVRRAPRPSVPA